MHRSRRPEVPSKVRTVASRPVWWLCLVALILGCGSAEIPPEVVPDAPKDRDRESWGVRLQLHSASSGSVTVEAPYVTDHIDVQQTRADSGVTVTLADSSGEIATHINAHRLVVDHRAHTVALAGSVLARATVHRVEMRTDTMTWDRTEDRFDLPLGVDVTLATGHLAAAQLTGGSDLAQWTAKDVRSTFGDSSAAVDEVRVSGRSAQVRSDSTAVIARFDSARASWRDRDVSAQQALYDGHAQTLVLKGSVVLQDSMRQMAAEMVELDLSARRIYAHGVVRATGDLHLEADELREDDIGRWSVRGEPLRLDADNRRLEARQMQISADMDTVIASGTTGAVEGDRTIQADSLVLVRPSGQLEAIGSVRVVAGDVQGQLRSEHLRSTGAGKHVMLWDGAQLTRPRPDAEDLTLAADTLYLDNEAGLLSGSGTFVLRSPPRLELRAQRGIYHTSGDTATLAGQAQFLYDGQDSQSRLSADTCHVVLSNGEPTAVDWPGHLEGRMKDAEQTLWLQAQSGHGDLVDGRISRLTLQGQVEVTHRGSSQRLSRFTAASMRLTYGEDGVLQQVQAEGHALVRTRLPDDADGGNSASLNEVGGARLEVDLHGGAVVAVRVLDKIEGRFVPDDADDSVKD